MADEFDRKLMPELLQTVCAVSLGATYKSIKWMMSPVETFRAMMSETRALITIPPDAGEGLTNKAQAVAAVWMEKSATLLEQCKSAGLKFTEDK